MVANSTQMLVVAKKFISHTRLQGILTYDPMGLLKLLMFTLPVAGTKQGHVCTATLLSLEMEKSVQK